MQWNRWCVNPLRKATWKRCSILGYRLSTASISTIQAVSRCRRNYAYLSIFYVNDWPTNFSWRLAVAALDPYMARCPIARYPDTLIVRMTRCHHYASCQRSGAGKQSGSAKADHHQTTHGCVPPRGLTTENAIVRTRDDTHDLASITSVHAKYLRSPYTHSGGGKLLHDAAVARRNARFVTMMKIAHHPLPAHEHIAYQRRVAGKQKAVHQGIARTRGKLRGRIVQYDQVGACAFAQLADRQARGTCTALQRSAPQGFAHAIAFLACGNIAMTRRQALAVLEPPQFFHRRHRNMRVRTDAEHALRIQVIGQREQAVTEIGFGGRAQARYRSASCDLPHFAVLDMRRVHQAPARIDVGVVKQPFHWPCATRGQAVLHFADLFGDVNMDRHTLRQLGREYLTHGLFRDCTQGMQGHTNAKITALMPLQCFQQAQVDVHIVAETALECSQRTPIEAAAHVEHRQQGQYDACLARRFDQGQRHRLGLCVRRAVGAMMQVLELAALGVARLEHFYIELRGNRLELFRPDRGGEGVHGFAPGPEAVVTAALALGQASHGALERMRMEVGHTR